MKKHITIAVALIIVFGVLISDTIYYYRQVFSTTFDVSEYIYNITEFKCYAPYRYRFYDTVPRNIGSISSKKEAKERADELFLRILGKEINKQKPYYCFYDENADVWHITTKKAFRHIWERNRFGGGAFHLIVRSDGEVLAVWWDK